MTYLEIKSIEEYIKKLEDINCDNYEESELYDLITNIHCQIRSSVSDYDPVGTDWDNARRFDYDSYNMIYDKECMRNIIIIIIVTLKGILNKQSIYSDILRIREIIKEGKSCLECGENISEIEHETECQEYARKALALYEEAFSENTYAYLTGKSFGKSSKNINIILDSLEKYMNEICSSSAKTKKRMLDKNNKNFDKEIIDSTNSSAPNITVNAYGGNATAQANSTADVKIDISLQIENTREEVKNACLGEKQQEEILAKLRELEEILKEKSKPKRWDKIKGTFKWLAEQGLQVASWLMPIIYQIVSTT